MKAPIEGLLLDLGGVLYGVDYLRTIKELGLSPQDLPALLQDPTLALYEKGLISTEAFLAAWQKRFPHLSPQALVQAWNAMLLGPLPDAEKLLQALAAQYPLALLSNTNDLHLTVVEPQISSWKPYFVEWFFSNRLHRRKPDPDTYRFAVERLGWDPHKTLFVDDSPLNLQGAQAAGLQTYHLTPPNQPLQLQAFLQKSYL